MAEYTVSLMIAALVVSFRKRSFFNLVAKSSSKVHTFRFCACVVEEKVHRDVQASVRNQPFL